MKNINIRTSLKTTAATLLLSAMLSPTVALGDSGHGHSNMSEQGQMMNQKDMGQHMKEVMGTGRINKVMKDKHMVNIVHEPIAELEWPKMRMNFKVSDQVKLDELKPGQEVEFKLQVNKDNSYLIKSIETK